MQGEPSERVNGEVAIAQAARENVRIGKPMKRKAWGSVLLAVAATGLACGNSAADDKSQTRAAETDVPHVLADCHGALREIALHYVPNFAEELASTYDDLFAALPIDVQVQVICSSSEAVEAFKAHWGAAERENGRCVEVINVDRPITAWARDRRVARVTADAQPAGAIIPRDCRDYGDDYRNDLFVPYLLEHGGLSLPGEDTFVHIEGGNIVANGRHIFVGANVIEDNEALGNDAATVKRELLRILGRPYVLVGNEDQRAPWRHVDMYLTPIDDHTVLVASTAVADMLLSSRTGLIDQLAGVLAPEDCVGLLTRRSNRFEAIAAQLTEYGYDVVRLPALADPGEEWMVTYNNVLMEERDGQRIVYMPVYDLPVLDQAAEAVYRSLGFEVHTIDVSQVFQHGGAVRCLVNVLSREPAGGVAAEEPEADAVPALGMTLAPAPVELTPSPPESYVSFGLSPKWFPVAGAWLPLFIFFARILDVSIGTVRLICITRGRRTLAISLAFVEVTIWLLAVASVITHLNNWLNILAYVSGFTAGNGLGMWIEQRLALGVETVILISQQKGAQIAAALREAELRLTTFAGSGRDGPVEICLAFVPRRLTPVVLSLSKAIDPDIVATVEDVRHTNLKWAGGGGTGTVLPTLSGRRFRWIHRRQVIAKPKPESEQAA